MGIFERLKMVFEAKANDMADAMEDPKLNLRASLQKLEESRGQVIRSLVDVSAARQRLVNQYNLVVTMMEKYQAQAQSAVSAGRDDLARTALERKQAAQVRRQELEGSIASMDAQVDSLKESQVNLERKISLFRSKVEELGAIYDASRVQVQLREQMTGISRDLSDVGHTIQRAEQRILEMRSRADAIERLVDEGTLVDVLEPGQDDVDRELLRLNRSQAVDTELERLKALPNQDPPRKMLSSFDE